MNTPDCQRWTELVDRVAISEVLTSEEARFEQEHRKICPWCAEEARVWATMSACLADERNSSSQISNDLSHDIAVRRLQTQQTRAQVWTRPRQVAAFTAMAVGFIASLFVWRNFQESDDALNVPLAQLAAKTAPVDLRLVSGEVNVGGSPASAGATLSARDRLTTKNGRACVAYSNGTSACLSEQSELSPQGQSLGDRTLHLSRGEVVCNLDKQPENTTFSVETSRGTITAKGTAFAVSYLATSEVEVRLHRGVVEVRSSTGEVRELHAPTTLILGEKMRSIPLSASDWKRDEASLSVTELWAEGAVAPLDVDPETKNTEVTLGGVKLGRAPVSMLVSRGAHDLRVEAEGYSPHQETLLIKGAGRVTRSPTLELPKAPDEPVKNSPSVGPQQSASELLSVAQKMRHAGKFRDAAATYQGLIRIHPHTAEARAAWLSLGELQLSQLGAPSQALDSFERYLSKKGALSQEAHYGKIRALRQLGRANHARSEAEKFVLAYPGTAQAVSLKQWLSVPATDSP